MSEGLNLGDVVKLERVVDRDALGEMCRSFFDLFGLPVRIVSADGTLLANVHVDDHEVCTYVNTTRGGHDACTTTVQSVRAGELTESVTAHPCFTGAAYRIGSIEHDGRKLGRVIVGPYLPAELEEVPKSLLSIDQDIEPRHALKVLETMPRVRAQTAERICKHLLQTIELIVFSGHRAHLTSEMHLRTVRENYRTLAEKNARLQEAVDEVRQLDRLKTEFLATVSHELRTPLTSIIGYSEMLEAGFAGELTDEQRDYVKTIRRRGDLLLQLVSNLLDMNKLEQGRLTLRHSPYSPKDIVEETLATAKPMLDKKKLRVSFDSTDPIAPFVGDAIRMRQVLQNLIDNAIKFTPNGGEISLSLEETQKDPSVPPGSPGYAVLASSRRRLRFTVRDSGIGIPSEEHERIFRAFYQVDGSATREHGGTGLGLSIVRRLVEAHGGVITVRSEPGQGTEFAVDVPEASVTP